MHRLSRGIPPIDLNRIKKRFNNDFIIFYKQDKTDHDLLSVSLYASQEHYCAYCETVIRSVTDGHIEHLERRSDNPARSFDWSNMFFSCSNLDSCGKFKDNSKKHIAFHIQDIIDPCVEDPQDFFTYDMEGNMIPRPELPDMAKVRAEETIRIFNLNASSRLRNMRKKAVISAECFWQNSPSEDEVDDYLSSLEGTDFIAVYYTLLGRRMP